MTPRRLSVILAATLATLVIAIVAVLLSRDPGDDTVAPQPSTTPSASTATASPSASSPTPTPTEGSTAPATSDAEKVVTTFIRGWLATDPDDREELLSQSAVPYLAELLMDTDPEAIPDTAADGQPEQVDLPKHEAPEHSPDARRYHQELSDGSAVLVDIIPDPEHGWLAAAILPDEEG